jgi:hypothetical protein
MHCAAIEWHNVSWHNIELHSVDWHNVELHSVESQLRGNENLKLASVK